MKARMFWYNAKEALKFYFKADTVHTIDSPFLFPLLFNTLEKNTDDDFIIKITNLRKRLFVSKEKFRRKDLGQGSSLVNQNEEVKLGSWAQTSSISRHYGELLFKLSAYLRPDQVLELGTAAGISAAYLAAGNEQSHLFSLEADPYLCTLARKHINSLGLRNVTIRQGEFADTLRPILNEIKTVELAFIDGHHHSTALLNQLDILYPYLRKYKIVVVDDIRWSEDMYWAWQKLVDDERWNIALDFFRMGILIYNTDIKYRIDKMVIASKWKRWSLGLFR